MKGTKLQKLAALVLCAAMLLSSATLLAFADNDGTAADGSHESDRESLENIKELLNAISYDEYSSKYNHEEYKTATQTVNVPISAFETEDKGFQMVTVDGREGLSTPRDGSVSWKVNIPESGLYAMLIEYYPDAGRTTSIERVLMINGKVPFAEARFLTLPKNWVSDYEKAIVDPGKQSPETVAKAAADAGFTSKVEDGKVIIEFPAYITSAMSAFCDEYSVRYLKNDIKNNELRPTSSQDPIWMTYHVKDSSGYYLEDFEFYLQAGENVITLESKNEPMTIGAIRFYPMEQAPSYEKYAKKYAGEQAGQDVIRLEGEFPTATSHTTIYPVEDRSCAINSPTDVSRSVLNTVGGDKWQTAGQWLEFRFKVGTSGMYDVVTRFKQDVLDGMSTCRALYLFSTGLNENDKGYYNGVPFAEAKKLTFNYSPEWQVTALSNGIEQDSNGDGKINKKDVPVSYAVYLEKDVLYTIRLEVTLGKMGEIVNEVQDILTHVNNDYLEIIKLTGVTPDPYRDYGFTDVMPDTMVDMVIQSQRLTKMAEELTAIAGEKSANVATLEKVSRLLDEMGKDDDDVAKNLSNLKTYIGTLGTFLSDAQTQPLQVDFVLIQPRGAKLPAATPNFFQSFVHEIGGFWQSFWRDYNSMGALEETSDEAAKVWLATARDQSQVIRNMINNDFTPKTNIAVDLKLVAGGTLLPSILAGSGPDVYLGLGQGDVINYAIRSALLNIEGFEDFEEVKKSFNDAAMIVLAMEDADEVLHYYGLPEMQSFPMMFVRIDVLADLDLEVPESWDELMACIPTLQANNMQIGLTTDYKIFLYQNNGELFADKGMRINLDSQLGLHSFEKMCDLFTMYSFPYVYNASNRFRTGEMPIILGDYTGTYNQLKVFATEIEGKWEFLPMPGEVQPDGSINNVSISGVSADVMVKGCEGEAKKRAWEFMKWFTGETSQVNYANEMVAIMGPSAKQATANRAALASLPWTTSEYEQVKLQFENLASIPNYPGSYIIDRYTNFAFLAAYNSNADPSESLLQYINTINKEITRKRNEFNLETLSDGTTDYKDLLTKRLAQLSWLVDAMKKNKEYSSEYDALLAQIQTAIKSDNVASLMAAEEAVRAAYTKLDPDGSKFLADRTTVMGYDMTDVTLTKDQKKKVRKCYSYEVYRNTSSLTTQLKCAADFLGDAASLTK